MPHILIVEDEPTTSWALAEGLSDDGFTIDTFRTAEEALAWLKEHDSDLVITDLRLPGMSGLELQGELKARGSRMPVVVLTAHGDVPLAVAAMKAGAVDFIEKPGSEADILAALERAHEILCSRPETTVPPNEVATRLARLTGREREVVDQLLLGNTNKQIAESLGISQRTVEIHRARIREKLDVRSLSDLIRLLR